MTQTKAPPYRHGERKRGVLHVEFTEGTDARGRVEILVYEGHTVVASVNGRTADEAHRNFRELRYQVLHDWQAEILDSQEPPKLYGRRLR